jgi:acetylornithine deacetylase
LDACAEPYKLYRMDAPATDAPHASTADILSRPVSCDATCRNSNLALIGFVRAYLDAHGIAYRVSADATGGKANIHAIIGPQQPGGVALSGHVDTVPVDGQAWSADPFTLRRASGRLNARSHVAQAHQPDEWIAQDQLDACDAFIGRLADRLLA